MTSLKQQERRITISKKNLMMLNKIKWIAFQHVILYDEYMGETYLNPCKITSRSL